MCHLGYIYHISDYIFSVLSILLYYKYIKHIICINVYEKKSIKMGDITKNADT